MAKYFIYEGNLDRLKTQLTRIENKCKKYNLDFHFEVTGVEEFRKVEAEDDTIITARFVEIEVEGIMRHADWEFIAKIDHMSKGNIIRQFKTDIEVPEKYRTTDSICEHCNTRRGRKFTYLIHNVKTDDWKQVGSSCLQEFTNGLDAEAVAKYISAFDYIISGEAPYTGISYTNYHSLRRYMYYAKETVNKFGYISAAKSDETGGYSTRTLAWRFYRAVEMKDMFMDETREEADEIEFKAEREENKKYVEDAINWIRNLSDEEKNENSFMYNLYLACSEDYFVFRNLGFVTSLIPTYNRHLAKIEAAEKAKKDQETNPSRHQGEIGKRIEFKPASIICVCSNDSMYGPSFLYKILDEAGNVYMWSTANRIETEKEFNSIRGTVKSHGEFRGVQQTFLTRCKVA